MEIQVNKQFLLTQVNYIKIIISKLFLITNLLKATIVNYQIPSVVSSPVSNGNTSFLLLNSEFRNETNLFGFQLYSALNGSINIQVKIFIQKRIIKEINLKLYL